MAHTISIPNDIQYVLDQLHAHGYEGYIVGGCVRDSIMRYEPKDWDITTNALPDQIQAVFPDTLYLNTFGTVTVRAHGTSVEVTTYRSDGSYQDHRHPDNVQFGVSLREDLQRRDFTINALAYDGKQIVDEFNGIQDIQDQHIRAVGDATQRFQEDALRMLRAIRFSSQLGFSIEPTTWEAIVASCTLLTHVSAERVRDELIKMLQTDDSFKAVWQLHTSGLLHYIIPELEVGSGVEQNLHHIYTVLTHNLLAMQFCPSDEWQVRLAALLHDVGKPNVKEGSGRTATFYQHEHVGAKLTKEIMQRLAFSKHDIKRVTHLVRHHMFFSDTDDLTDAGVRRLLQRVGVEHMEDLIAVRVADRMGSGVYKEKPYRLQELEKRIEYVQQDPISTSMLAIDGVDIMDTFKLKPGAQVGVVLHRLLELVLEDPARNTKEYLMEQARTITEEVATMPDQEARGIMKQYRSELDDKNAYKS